MAGPAGDAARCPVCRNPVPGHAAEIAGDVECQHCGWLLFTGYRLGRVTPAVERAFADQLNTAMRQLDAIAVVIASGYPEPANEVLLGQISSLARHGPPTAVELEAASGTVTARVRAGQAQARRAKSPASAGSSARQAAILAAQTSPVAETVAVLELSPDGVLARTYGADCRWERSWLEQWSWSEIFPALPDELAVRRFWLAGGVNDELPQRSQVPEAARRWAEQHASGWPAMTVLLQQNGWPVLDAFAAELSARGAVVPGCEPGITRESGPAARRVATEMTACAVAELAPARATGNSAPVRAAAAKAGRVLIAGSDRAGEVDLWAIPADPPAEAGSDRPMLTVPLRSKTLSAIALAPDGDDLLTGARDGDVTWRTIGSGQVRKLSAHAGRVAAVRFAPGGMLSIGIDGWLHWVPVDGARNEPDIKRKLSFNVGVSGCHALAAAESGALAVAGGIDGVVRLADLTTGSLTDLASIGPAVTALAMDQSGGLVATGLADGTVHLLDLGTKAWRAHWPLGGRSVGSIVIRVMEKGRVITLAMSDVLGQIYYSAGRLNEDEGTMSELGMHEGGVRGLGLLATGDVISVGRDDGVARIWVRPLDSQPGRPGGQR